MTIETIKLPILVTDNQESVLLILVAVHKLDHLIVDTDVADTNYLLVPSAVVPYFSGLSVLHNIIPDYDMSVIFPV